MILCLGNQVIAQQDCFDFDARAFVAGAWFGDGARYGNTVSMDFGNPGLKKFKEAVLQVSGISHDKRNKFKVEADGQFSSFNPTNKAKPNLITAQGRVHIVTSFVRTDNDDPHYKHYWRDTRGNWQNNTNRLNFSGARARLYVDKHDNLLLCTSGSNKVQVRTASALDNYANWNMLFEEDSNLRGSVAGDQVLLKEKGILSISLQKRPVDFEPTPIEIFDLQFEYPLTQNPPVAMTDRSEKNTPGELAWIPILSNDRLGNGARITGTERVSVDLKPWSPAIDAERRVEGEGVWNVVELFGTWVVVFTPDAGFQGNPIGINYELIDKEFGLSDKANVRVTYATNLGDRVIVYPNPVRGEITISPTGDERIDSIKIYNTEGMIVKESFGTDSQGEKMDMSGQSPGMYFVEVLSQGKRTMRKIIVK